jgi:hypothetical protein
VSSFEYIFVNGVPRWGSGGFRMAFLMLPASRAEHQVFV